MKLIHIINEMAEIAKKAQEGIYYNKSDADASIEEAFTAIRHRAANLTKIGDLWSENQMPKWIMKVIQVKDGFVFLTEPKCNLSVDELMNADHEWSSANISFEELFDDWTLVKSKK